MAENIESYFDHGYSSFYVHHIKSPLIASVSMMYRFERSSSFFVMFMNYLSVANKQKIDRLNYLSLAFLRFRTVLAIFTVLVAAILCISTL